MPSPEAQKQMQAIIQALQPDPNSQYGELLPYAVTPGQEQNRGSTGPGAHPYAQRTGSSDARFAMPNFLREGLLGATDMMRGAAGELPPGEPLPPRATMAMADIPLAGAGRAFDPSMLGANWGGKSHAKRLKQLWHGTGAADSLREQGSYTRGRSAELGLSGTSLSYDPSVSYGQFGKRNPEGFFGNVHDIDPSEVYNLRPSDYLAKDYSGAIPSQAKPAAKSEAQGTNLKFEPAPAKPQLGDSPYEALKDHAANIAEFEGGKVALDMLPHFMENVKFDYIDKGGPFQATLPNGEVIKEGEVGDLIQKIMDSPGGDDVFWTANIQDEQSVLDTAKLFKDFDQDPKVADEWLPQDFEAKPGTGPEEELSVGDVAQSDDVLGGALDNAGFKVVKENGSYWAVDTIDNETVAVGNTPQETVSELASKELISGADVEAAGGSRGSTLDPGGPEGGAALIRKPQSYYQEGEYFAPTETGGQGRLMAVAPRGTNKPTPGQGLRKGQEQSKLASETDTQVNRIPYASTPQEVFARLKNVRATEGGAKRRELGRGLATKLKKFDVGAARVSPEREAVQVVNRAFFPKQQQQLERIGELARDIERSRDMQDSLRPSAARGERRGAARQQFDDAVRAETRAIDRLWKAIDESDVPVSDARKRAEQVGDEADRLQMMLKGKHSALLNLGSTGNVVARNMQPFIEQAGAEQMPLKPFTRYLQDDLKAKGPVTQALAKGDTEGAMQLMKRKMGGYELDADNPEDILK